MTFRFTLKALIHHDLSFSDEGKPDYLKSNVLGNVAAISYVLNPHSSRSIVWLVATTR
jgi:hypothetical protein